MDTYFERILKPGDVLFYSGSSLFSKLIQIKTYSDFSHVAVYIGDGKQREFREGVGAIEGPFRSKNLVMIRRPRSPWNREESDKFWDEVKDEGYDYIGLFWTFYARKTGRANKRMFCSEYVVRDYNRAVGPDSFFSEITDADGVSPGDLARSPMLSLVWRK